MFNVFTLTITVSGAAAGAIDFVWTAPFNCTLHHVSSVQSNAGSARMKIGTSSDDDEFLTYTNLGVSGTPVETGDAVTDWRYDVKPAIEKGDLFQVYVDHDGASGTAGEDICVVLTFTKD